MMRWAALLCLFVSTAAAPAQNVMSTDHGTHAFRATLHKLGLQPIAEIESILQQPDKSLLIVLGDTDVKLDYLMNGGLRQFVKRGGACLFASDQSTHRLLEQELEVIINGILVYCEGNTADIVYRGDLDECPILQVPIREEFRSDHVDLLQGLKRVATNRPSFLQRLETPMQTLSTQRVVAETPRNYRFLQPIRLGNGPPTLHLAVADQLGRGRYCVIADHSIFINAMMLQSDNDNVAFAVNVINWLTENGQRHQVMFIDDRQVRTEFDFNLDFLDPPLPHPDVLAPAVDKLIRGLEEDNFFNRLISRLIPQKRLLRYLLLGLSIGSAALILYRITSNKHRRESAAARLPDRIEAMADATSLDDRAGFTTDPQVLATVGHELIQRTFHDLLGSPVSAQPSVVAGNWWARRRWTTRVRRLWRLQSPETLRTISAPELKSLARQLDDLRRAVDRGTIALTVEETA